MATLTFVPIANKLNSRAIVEAVRNETTDVISLWLGFDMDPIKSSKSAMEVAEIFDADSDVALVLLEAEGMMLVRRNFFLECESVLDSLTAQGLFLQLIEQARKRGLVWLCRGASPG